MSDLISRVYSGFRGVDFRSEDCNILRSPNCLNVWKDYKSIDCIQTRPKMKLLEGFTDTIWGIYFYKTGAVKMMIVHSGTKLYKIVNNVKTELYSGVNNASSDAFIFAGIWYFKDGVNYLRYDGSKVIEVVGYVPTTSIGRSPAGGGTIKEDVNLLTGRRINTFKGDGGSRDYYLDAQKIDSDFKPIVKVNDVVQDNNLVTVDYEKGIVTLAYSVSAPASGNDNVSIEFSKTISGYKNRINKCTLLQVFDNRVFFSGNSAYPNTIWHCSINDPTYCSDLDYYNEGLDNAKVKGMAAGNNALWIFKEPSQANTTVFYHTPTMDSEYGKIYPSVHSSISTGCVGKAINFNDDIVFFSDRGMEGISGDVTTEQAIAHRSSLIDPRMISETNYKNLLLEEWEGYLMIFIDNKVYLADSRAMFSNETHVEYDFFYWELGKKITCTCVNEGVLYLGTDDGVYTMTDYESDIVSYWTTPKDKFNYPHKLKTTNKRGCVVEAVGDISVYAKTEATGFELIGKYENITDYFVSRIKRKKFKDLQLKFHSDTRFSLETATIETFIGGYIKR